MEPTLIDNVHWSSSVLHTLRHRNLLDRLEGHYRRSPQATKACHQDALIPDWETDS